MRRAAFFRGAARAAPVAASVIPFALIVAVTAIDAGISATAAAGMSLIVFAGAAQLASIEIAQSGAPALVVIGAAVLVNLRFVMYSAAMAPRVRGSPVQTRAAMAYLLTDQAFALALTDEDREAPPGWIWAYLGAAAALWAAWQIGTVTGIALGSGLPAGLSLDFAAALAFISIVVPALTDAPAIAAAITSVAVYILCAGLPYGLGLLPAVGAAVLVGALADRRAS